MAQSLTISGSALRARIDKLGLTYTDAARRLGLSLDGLQKQMRGARPVSLQTEIILGHLEWQRVHERDLDLYPTSRRTRS